MGFSNFKIEGRGLGSAIVLEYFEANNTVYYALEYVDGGNLDTYITQKKGLTEAESIMYAKQIGDALSYMHAHKMLHLRCV